MKKFYFYFSILVTTSCANAAREDPPSIANTQQSSFNDTTSSLIAYGEKDQFNARYEKLILKLDSLSGFDEDFLKRYSISKEAKEIPDLRIKVSGLLVKPRLTEQEKSKVDTLLDRIESVINDLTN